MTARSFQFPIPRVYPPGYARARPLFALSAAGGRRCAERVTNVHDPRRSFFLSLPRGHVSLPALVAREIRNSISSAHDRLRFRQQGTTGTFEDVQKAFAKEANV